MDRGCCCFDQDDYVVFLNLSIWNDLQVEIWNLFRHRNFRVSKVWIICELAKGYIFLQWWCEWIVQLQFVVYLFWPVIYIGYNYLWPIRVLWLNRDRFREMKAWQLDWNVLCRLICFTATYTDALFTSLVLWLEASNLFLVFRLVSASSTFQRENLCAANVSGILAAELMQKLTKTFCRCLWKLWDSHVIAVTEFLIIWKFWYAFEKLLSSACVVRVGFIFISGVPVS